VGLFGRTFRYENQAIEAIHKAKAEWSNIEDALMALEWGLMRDTEIGPLLNERGLRGFTFPGARSLNEPDIDVLYVATDTQIVVEGLIFRHAKAHYSGTA
jgi:hypothetical protein